MTTSSSHGIAPATVETLAGLSAGLVSTIIVHPLDIIKTRLQVNAYKQTRIGSSVAVFRGLLRNEGPSRRAALYRGLTPNLVGNSAGWGLYFLWYDQFQKLIHTYRDYEPGHPLSSADYLAASAASGVVTAVLTNPIWVVKTRMLSTSGIQKGAYPSMWEALKSIGRTEGIRGYFHGLVPSLAGVSHGALYFLAYEKLKLWKRMRNVKRKNTTELTNMDTILTSSLSKIFAGSLTYPHQLVRARLQTYNPSRPATKQLSLTGVIRSVWRNEGPMGFYKGLGPNLLRVVPSTCVTFLVYENVKFALPRLSQGDSNQGAAAAERSVV